MKFTDENGNKYEVHATMPMVDKEYLVIKPVKKTEKKLYILVFDESGSGGILIDEHLNLTPTTANKLSEAISALVANVTASEPFKQNYVAKAEEARKSYQESQ